MDKRLSQFYIALSAYPVFWLLGNYVKFHHLFRFEIGLWPWAQRVLVVNVLVLVALWFLEIKPIARGILYVIGTSFGGLIAYIWMNRLLVNEPDFGWGFILQSFFGVWPLFLGSALGVIGLLWILKRSDLKPSAV